MKLATNLVLGLNRAALAEGLAFARAIGLDPKLTLAVLRAGAAFSRVMETKGPKMMRGDFSPEAIHALAEEGHHVDVVHCVDSFHLLHPGEPRVKFAEHPNVVRHELRSGYKWLSPLLTQQTGRPLLKRKAIGEVLASRLYDVVHFHNISLLGPEILSAVPAGGQAVKMYTTHEHWLICPMHVLWKFNRQPCDRPECLRCTLHSRSPSVVTVPT